MNHEYSSTVCELTMSRGYAGKLIMSCRVFRPCAFLVEIRSWNCAGKSDLRYCLPLFLAT